MKKERVQEDFFAELRRVPIVQVACERCGISRQSVYRWRQEDPEFAERMEDALYEGEVLINDMCESQLLSLIKEKQYAAIRFWLVHRHPKYKKVEPRPTLEEKAELDRMEADRIIQELGLTGEDFSDENIDRTTEIIIRYLLKR